MREYGLSLARPENDDGKEEYVISEMIQVSFGVFHCLHFMNVDFKRSHFSL